MKHRFFSKNNHRLYFFLGGLMLLVVAGITYLLITIDEPNRFKTWVRIMQLIIFLSYGIGLLLKGWRLQQSSNS